MLFTEQLARKPNKYSWTQDFIDKIWTGFWTPNEFDFKSDCAQFRTELNEQERLIIVRTLSAIGQIEIAVKRFWAQLGDHLPHPSMYDLGYVMANTEVIHNQAYEKLIETLSLSAVFESNLKEPVIKNRVEYLRKYLSRVYENDRKQYIYSIILFTLFVENVSLFSQFYIVLWFNRFRNVLKDTAQQVQYTRNEELLHAQIGIKIINTMREEYPEFFDDELKARVQEECQVAYRAEKRLVEWMLGDFEADTLNREVLKQYIKNRFHESLMLIGFESHFRIDKDILAKSYWMDEELYGNNVTDFFAKKPVDYAKHNKVFNAEDLF